MNEQTSEITGIQQRLVKLERENRRMKMAATTMLLGLVGMVTMGTAQSWSGRYVEASRFVLKDASGHIRGQWVAEADSSGLSLYDPQEKPVLEILHAADQHAAKLSLISSKGVISLWATSDDVGVIARDSNGPYVNDRIFLGLRNSPSVPMLRLNDSNGNVRVFFTSGSGSGVGVISDDKGEPFWVAIKKSDSR